MFNTKELDEDSVYSILEYTAKDKKTYQTKFYNLDAILSIGYRVNSQYAIQFRIWANKILKEYLVKGYVVNEKIKLHNIVTMNLHLDNLIFSELLELSQT